MGTDPNLAGLPSTTDFQLGVFAERLASLQGGMQRLENTQQQTFGLIKEMNAAHNAASIKLETVEQRTRTIEGDIIEHGGTIAKKADEMTIKEIEAAVASKAPQAEVDRIDADVEDLKKGKWTVIGVCIAISGLGTIAAIAAPFIIRH